MGVLSTSSSVTGRRRWALGLSAPLAWLLTETWAIARFKSSIGMPYLAA